MNLGAIVRAVWTALMLGIIVVSLCRFLIVRHIARNLDPSCRSCNRDATRILSSRPVFDRWRKEKVIGLRHRIRCNKCGAVDERFHPDWRAL